MARKTSSKSDSTVTIGFEAKEPVRPDLAADKLRNNMGAAVSSEATPLPQAKAYKHGVLGLIFLKYIADNTGKFRIPNSGLGIPAPFDLGNSPFAKARMWN